MSEQTRKGEGSRNRPDEASKKPAGKVKSKEREARLAEALRANLRRRKSPNAGAKKED